MVSLLGRITYLCSSLLLAVSCLMYWLKDSQCSTKSESISFTLRVFYYGGMTHAQQNIPKWESELREIARLIEVGELNIDLAAYAVLQAYDTFISECGHPVSADDYHKCFNDLMSRPLVWDPSAELEWWARSWDSHPVFSQFFKSQALWEIIQLASDMEYCKDFSKMNLR